MTVNKSQGQSLRVVGVRLEEPTFTNWLLYFADSKVGDPQHLIFAVIKSVSQRIRDVVYKEIL